MMPWCGVGRSSGSPWILVAFALAGAAHHSRAAAHERGIAVDSCDGCHGGGAIDRPALSLTAEPPTFAPGDLVTLALSVSRPAMKVAGAYIVSNGVGMLQPLPGEGLATNGQGLSHTAPKMAESGAATFRFAWRAPAAPGAVSFGVAALAGNDNGASSGDAPGTGIFQWVFGCSARSFFVDLDRDGYGSKALGTRLACVDSAAPPGYASEDGDCNENDERAHPGATEVCNKQDDDCDGEVDEGAPPVTLWPDPDGDGFYQLQAGTPKTGCGDVVGYAALGGDCDELDESVNPGASETCNNKDDDCDGQVDEQTRPQCGVGWCARYSSTCDPADCRPGPPTVEACNAFDDDCDGVADNDACSEGLVCAAGTCVAPGGDPGDLPSEAGGASAAGSSTTAGSSATSGGTGAGPTPAAASPGSGCSMTRTRGSFPGVAWLVAGLLGLVRARGSARRRRGLGR